MDAILSFISNILAAILPSLVKKKEPTEIDKRYEKLRFDVAEALDLYACYYRDPVDLAKQPDHKLPQEYVTASKELRKLGSTASALAATTKRKNPSIKTKLMVVSGNLTGLSNSMCTPYNCSYTYDNHADVRVAEIRKQLDIEIERPLRRSCRGAE